MEKRRRLYLKNMDAKCFICEKKIKHGDEYTSTHKGIYSEEGDKDWIALIFHRNCWTRFGKGADKKSVPIFEVEV
jgi:hypothetical protein